MRAVYGLPAAALGAGGYDLYYGDVFGAASRIFGYEVDGLAYTFRDGLPYPAGGMAHPTASRSSPWASPRWRRRIDGERGVDHFLGEDDLVFAAEAVFGAATPEAIERLRYGSGMMVSVSAKAAARYSPPAPANGSPA